MQFKNKTEFIKHSYCSRSFFQNTFSKDFHIENTTSGKWNNLFRKELCSFLTKTKISQNLNGDLEHLHKSIDPILLERKKGDNPSNDRNIIMQTMYDFAENSEDLYHNFLIWVHEVLIKEDFYFQKIPTIRCHLPDENFLYPKWHSDCFLGHPPKEINLWFGLTNNKESGFWIMDVENSKQWLNEHKNDTDVFLKEASSSTEKFNHNGFKKAVEVKNIFNSVFMFDSRCIHTALNRTKTDFTARVSLDTRIILRKDFEWLQILNEPVFIGTGVKKAHFKPGGQYGYHTKSIKEIISKKELK